MATTLFKRMEAIKNESDERTYGYYPSARHIRVADRRREAKAAAKSLLYMHRSLGSELHLPFETEGGQNKAKLSLKQSPVPTINFSSSVTSRDAHRPIMPRGARTARGLASSAGQRNDWDPIIAHSAPADGKKQIFLTQLQLPHLENRGSGFYCSQNHQGKHHYICPEWVSEGMVTKRLRIENRSNPLRYGWI